jgi:primosomal protein N' (replication factor Y)
MDLDTTIKKGSHDSILKRFESQDADILLGTQMVAKGLDFPHVTLVGVISADTQMLLPDFRAAERTFQLLTQVAGRAGRSQLAGEVIIQSLQPTHYALEYVRTHNYKAFYEKELQHRNQLYYPPLSRLVLIEFSGQDESITTKYSRIYRDILKRWQGIEDYHILGPSEAAIPKLRGQFRKHLLIKILKSKDPSGTHLRNLIRQTNIEYELQVPEWHSQIEMTFDVDPQGLL